MTYAELKQKLQLTDTSLQLSIEKFPETGVADLLLKFFKKDQILIGQVNLLADDLAQEIAIQGEFQGGFLDIAAVSNLSIGFEAIFSIFNEAPKTVLKLSLNDTWLLSDALKEPSFLALQTDLAITDETLLTHSIVQIKLDSNLNLKLFVTPNISINLAQIPAYLKGEDASSSFPTEGIPSFDQALTFTSFEIAAGLSPMFLSYVGLEVAIQDKEASWKSLGEWAHFKEFSAHILLLNPLVDPLLSVELRTKVSIANKDIIGIILLPSLQFQCFLAPGEEISMKAVLEGIIGKPIPMPAISCTGLGINGNPKGHNYELYLTIKDVLEIDVGNHVFKVEALSGNFTYRTQPQSSASGTLTGLLKFDEIEILISAFHGSGTGWKFSGSTGPGQAIPIGTLLDKITAKFGAQKPLPEPLKGLIVKNLSISFNTETKNFTFGCEGDFTIEGKEVVIKLKIILSKQQDGSYLKDFDGQIVIGPLESLGSLYFDLHFIQGVEATLFAASFVQEGWELDFNLGTLISALSDQIDHIPIDLSVDLKDIILVFDKKPNETTKFLFALDINAGVNLSNLPLVGKLFPPDKSVGVDDLQFVLASAPIPVTEVNTWTSNNLLPANITPLPARDLNKGLSVDGKLNLGGFTQTIDLPISGSNTPPAGGTPVPDPNAMPPTSPDKAKWITVQKKIGPIYFERIGIQYDKGILSFLLDASLTAAGLTIALQGLSVGSPLKKFEPTFDLKGLGIDFKKGPLEIGGAFLRFAENEYDGTAIIKTEALSLAAIGSYAVMTDGHRSLFIYAVLDFPLGGPPFFFVTGLAAGFGYNRRLRVPDITKVANFPLISEAVNGAAPIPPGAGQRNALMGELTKIRTYIPPETGQYFLAVGIKFNSFKLVDSFALLTISFGNQFELYLLGLSTMVAPTTEAASIVEPLVEVQMAIKASFLPDEGFLGLEAQLTTASFLFSRKCHLTGGFAFYSWFNGPHKGDFVISLGGYHPSYQVPAHYPKVPRLGFNWQVTPQLSLKGEAYFALTASALMAGGRLEALWVDGNLRAWFIAGADFLIAWKPYHYDAHVYVDMGVSYTFHFFGTHTISVGLGADLHIWGPDFSGKAHIKLWIITFDVTFGAGASNTPQPIDWNTFRASFLPASDQDIVSISVISGIKQQPEANSGVDWIIDTKNFEFETNSVIPIKQGPLALDTANTAFGIAPMDLKSDQVDTGLEVYIKRKSASDNVPDVALNGAFHFEPIAKKVPTALWGTSVKPNLNGRKFDNTLMGYRIKLITQERAPGNSPDAIDRHKFQFATKDLNNYLQPRGLPGFSPAHPTDWKDQLKNALGENNKRNDLMNAMGFSTDTDIQLSDTYVDELILSPQFAGPEPV
ncbi:MAG: hypothetical protein DHS20C18_29660 [Saprospiraceae bacterium]|nr:MAG: hypothetical protein DHS20C18_29660 [Saprospiraceae bacterium]